MSNNKGFISINREVMQHWVYDDPSAFKLWLTILFVVNYKSGKLKLGKKLYTIKRGQCSMSLRSLANQSGMGVKKVTSTLDLFVSDGMIKRQTIGKGKQSTTLITVENYDDYQGVTETLEKHNGNMRETLEQHEGNAKGIQSNNSNNSNNSNKGIKENNIKEIPSFEDFNTHAQIKLKDKKVPDPSLYDYLIKAKYEAWVENDWCDGYDNPIIRWKSKLTNAIKYMNTNDIQKSYGTKFNSPVL